MKNFYFFALASLGEGLSGSDRIFIELARNWGKKFPVNIFVWEEGRMMCDRQELEYSLAEYEKPVGIKLHLSNMKKWYRMGFLVCYFARVFEGIRLGLTLDLKNDPETYTYSTNDFWMDIFPAVLLKLRFKKITWISSFYLAAPNPFIGFNETGKAYYRLPNIKLILYWFQQIPTYWLTRFLSDYVFVTSEPDRKRFPKQNSKSKVIVVKGGVRLKHLKRWRKKNPSVPRKYVAVFQGRFHPQKGVLELIDIWKKVVRSLPEAKLAMIGDGELMDKVKLKIDEYKLQKNIKLFGFMYDGPEKYMVFAQSKIVVHPAVYDSGGMAAAEAMALGLPCVGFDLKAFETYYPQGMLKVESGNIDAFAEAIIRLNQNATLFAKYRRDAVDLIMNHWSWIKKSDEILKCLL